MSSSTSVASPRQQKAPPRHRKPAQISPGSAKNQHQSKRKVSSPKSKNQDQGSSSSSSSNRTRSGSSSAGTGGATGGSIASPLRDTPISDFLSPFRPASTQWVARYAFISFALILRLAVGLGPYSGYQQEPMHGDFEAQRHWLEITYHLPMSQWYFYDLQWWGLDYPPLTAYHSWFLGAIANFVNPEWVALDDSRGSDDYNLKSFMRATALFSELAIYIPAVIWFVRWSCKRQGQSPISQSIAASAILFQPALILIDHGHFQYNSVMLGLALLAIVNLQYNNWLTASFFFVLSICFKQMALYYAPVIFAYLLGICVFPRIDFMRLVSIGIITLFTFASILAPLYISGGLPVLTQVAIRVFPFARGLWEDKVANVWCTLNTFVKLKELLTAEQLQRLSLLATLGAILPSMVLIFAYPKKHLLPWAFAACAWGFFLFSFQVHEKSVLIPLMPTTLLIAGGGRTAKDRSILPLVFWINNVAMFSLWPLLYREGLALQFFTMTLCWNWLVGNFNFLFQCKNSSSNDSSSTSAISEEGTGTLKSHFLPTNGIFWKFIVISSYLAMIACHLAEFVVILANNAESATAAAAAAAAAAATEESGAPVVTTTVLLQLLSKVSTLLKPYLTRFPDLFVVLNVTISCACFGLFWLWNLYKLFILRNTED